MNHKEESRISENHQKSNQTHTTKELQKLKVVMYGQSNTTARATITLVALSGLNINKI